jgi:UDP-glucose 4-epimerase
VLSVFDGTDELGPPDDPRIRFIPYEEAYAKGFEDMRRRVPDNSKVMAWTEWEPRHDLRKILRDVIRELER